MTKTTLIPGPDSAQRNMLTSDTDRLCACADFRAPLAAVSLFVRLIRGFFVGAESDAVVLAGFAVAVSGQRAALPVARGHSSRLLSLTAFVDRLMEA